MWGRSVSLAVAAALLAGAAAAQEQAPPPAVAPPGVAVPPPAPVARPLPINLATALQLSGARSLDVAAAGARVQAAAAQLQRAQVLWLPNVLFGTDYFRHDGQIQAVAGEVFGTSKGSFMLGLAPIAVFNVSDALFGPLAARQVLRARQASARAAANDAVQAVAEAYFNVQQARGELAGAVDAVRRAEEVVRLAEQIYKQGRVPEVEVVRARAELARRRQAVCTARERWRVTSAELIRLLHLDPSAIVEPLEPPHLQVTLVDPRTPADELVPVGLLNRPELAAQQALVRAALEQMRQEKLRPLVPSVLLRGASTNPAGTLAAGLFGGGLNDNMSNFGMRSDFDVQVLWEFQSLGFGNKARVNERRAAHRLALIEAFRLQDRVAAEVVQAHAQAQEAAARLADAEDEVRNAVDSVTKNLQGVTQTRKVGDLFVLLIRPQEVVAAVQALAQAYNDYYAAVGDYNRAQFRLYRAMGQPAELVIAQAGAACPSPPAADPAPPTR
ncbi:MAG TPA: TolC family protein [Gemmataceae bacterium]|nr:TolC family protein [Gemmataceae bacterium]